MVRSRFLAFFKRGGPLGKGFCLLLGLAKEICIFGSGFESLMAANIQKQAVEGSRKVFGKHVRVTNGSKLPPSKPPLMLVSQDQVRHRKRGHGGSLLEDHRCFTTDHPATYFQGSSFHCLGETPFECWQTERGAIVLKVEHAGNSLNVSHQGHYRHTLYKVAQTQWRKVQCCARANPSKVASRLVLWDRQWGDCPHQATQQSAFMIPPILFVNPNIIVTVTLKKDLRMNVARCKGLQHSRS